MIKGLAHLALVVKDLAASEEFYCGRLGMTPAFDFRRPDGTRSGMYIHAGGRSFIEIFQGNPTPPSATQSFRHLCLEVEDFDATIETLRARGVQVDNVKIGTDHCRQAWINDPDGNRIELHGYTPESKQQPWLK